MAEPPSTLGGEPAVLGGVEARTAGLADRVRGGARALRAVLAGLEARGLRTRWLVPLLMAAGLLLPPISLVHRLRGWTYARVRPGQELRVPAKGSDAGMLLFRRRSVLTPSRVGFFAQEGLPRDAAPLPGRPTQLGQVFRLDFRGSRPREAWLQARLDIPEGDQPFVDPFGWDGERWIWLPVSFPVSNQAEVYLPLETADLRYVVLTEASEGSTSIAASLPPPPAAVPAAVARLPILELRAYSLRTGDGALHHRRLRIPSRQAEIYGIVDNLEGDRVRRDLATNVLVQRDARLKLRQSIVGAVRRDRLAGMIVDFQGLPPHVQAIYAQWLGRLREDLHALDAELIVAVPMPRRGGTTWDSSPMDWRSLGAQVDGLRIRLPLAEPLETDRLDAMLRWALGSVERRKLQLSVPVQGRDEVEGDVRSIAYGEALGKILDMAAADLPERVDPGQHLRVELPTLRAAEFGLDPGTGMWRFYYWDANRRQHTVWLSDAAALAPAWEMARRYRMDRIALDGVTAGLDPSVWAMVESFAETGRVESPPADYSLQWTLLDEQGRIAKQAVQAVGDASFEFQAPAAEGAYRLSVNLVTQGSRLAALGAASDLRIAPPPPPTPTPTVRTFIIEPRPVAVQTEAAPADESVRRDPVKAGITPRATFVDLVDAVVSFREATLRAGPATAAELVTGLKVGDQLQIVGRSTDDRWLFVRALGTGLEGWILVDVVTVRIELEGVQYMSVGGTTVPPGDAVMTPVGPGPGATPTS